MKVNSDNIQVAKIRRPGVHSKNGVSNSKNSKLYKKRYKGQGR